jgi:hypothetical protein
MAPNLVWPNAAILHCLPFLHTAINIMIRQSALKNSQQTLGATGFAG